MDGWIEDSPSGPRLFESTFCFFFLFLFFFRSWSWQTFSNAPKRWNFPYLVHTRAREAVLKRTAGSTPKDTNTPLMKKARVFYTDLYLPANYVHEKQNQNEIQIFTKINSCFVSFLRRRCQNTVLSITDNSSDVCVCWWISWEALLLARAVKHSHLYFNGLRSSGRTWRRATISHWKRGIVYSR